MAIFISGLAYSDGDLVQEAKLGILVASVLAAVVGALILRRPNTVVVEDVHADSVDASATTT